MNKRLKTGILGGTFDPIHVGHLILAQNALETLKLDKVLIMPSGCSYLKDTERMTAKEHRLEMTRLATAGNDRFEVSSMETDREGNSYTYETLDILCRDNPDTDYFYITGADVFMTMDTWYRPKDIFSRCTVVCAQRNGIDRSELENRLRQYEREYGAKAVFMDVPEVAISSSLIRRLISMGNSCRYYLDDKVIEYIKEQGLYDISAYGNDSDR